MTTPRMRAAITAAACTLIAVTATPVAGAAPAGSSSPVDHLGRPTPAVTQPLLTLADAPMTPTAISTMIRSAVDFATGANPGGGTPLPADAPRFSQFLWPTAAQNCIDGSHQAVATAIAVPGPADLPLPGVPAGHTTFVFTVLGTGTVAKHQATPLVVHWANLTDGTAGQAPLSFTGINPTGPATVAATADTGDGLIVAAITGGLTTTENGHDSTCNFAPTVGWTTAGH